MKFILFLLFIPLSLIAETQTFTIGSRSYTLTIEEEYTEGGYDRHNWYHWTYLQDSNFTTRDKVLQEESMIPVVVERGSNGRDRVTEGLWICPFTGEELTNWRQVDIDHVVPLKEAFESGGWAWEPEKKDAFANYLTYEDHLMAVNASANRSKGARDPFEWMPDENVLEYIEAWLFIKSEWGLSVDPEEAAEIVRIIEEN